MQSVDVSRPAAGTGGQQVSEDVVDRIAAPSVYRPHLDGLRTLAVYLVVLFHAGLAPLAGGYIGVDVFFVLSGYLVTQLLVRDLAGGSRISFGRFYARRYRRLLPAAFVTLVVTAAVMTAISPTAALEAMGSFKAAFLYVANWYFIGQSTDYFAGTADKNPVLQFWSLAVEEQFYLVWPLLLGGLFWAARRWRRYGLALVRGVVLVGAVASLLWAIHLSTGEPDRAYFGTDTRAYQLLAGALLALVPGLVKRLGRFRLAAHIAAGVAVAAILVLGTSISSAGAIPRGAMVTVVTCLALVALECADGGLAKRVLSSGPFVYLGKISYGTYLWHWPVIIVGGELLELTPAAKAWSACLVATGLASLSFQLLEQPVRASRWLDRHRLAVIATGLTISVVSAVVVIPTVIDRGSSSSAAASAPTGSSGFTPIPKGLDPKLAYREGYGLGLRKNSPLCVDAAPEACILVRGKGKHVMLMGDSNAQMMIPAFDQLAKDHDLTFSVELSSGCLWQRDLYDARQRNILENCQRIKDDAYTRVIDALRPDLVVVINVREVRTPEGRDATTKSLKELTRDGRQVMIIEPIPHAEKIDPRLCLEKAEWTEECRFTTTDGQAAEDVWLRDIAASVERVKTADFDKLVCPFLPICDPIIGGTVVFFDNQHVTARYARTMADPIYRYLTDNKLLGS